VVNTRRTFQQIEGFGGAFTDSCCVARQALLFTEGCQEGGPHHGSRELGERYARSIINDLNRWTLGRIETRGGAHASDLPQGCP
jgi:O-glycosyl hydrolase